MRAPFTRRADPANTRLAPGPIDRLRTLLRTRGWPRTLALRRFVAIALVMLAAVLALRPAGTHHSGAADVVVAAHDLTAGHTLTAADLTMRAMPSADRPTGALAAQGAGIGHILASPVRAGEPLTDVRIVGPAAIALTTGNPTAATVPVRLADPDIADLLRPGIRVDVVTLDPDRQSDPVLAANATVLTVRDTAPTSGTPGIPGGAGQRGRLVLVTLPRESATQLAAASLRQPVTVTLR